MDKKKTPCLLCEDRHEGCHGTCEYYKSWFKDRFEKKKQIYEAKKKNRETYSFHVEQRNKAMRRNGYKTK